MVYDAFSDLVLDWYLIWFYQQRGRVMSENDRTLVQPSKEQVRAYLESRRAERKMPPSLEEIRRQLGWDLCEIAGRTAGVSPAK